MVFRSASAKGGWFNSAGTKAWDQAGTAYGAMADKVEASAKTAASRHIVHPAAASMFADPAASNTVATAMSVFGADDQLYAGLPGAHPALTAATDTEFGTETTPPAPHFRSAIADGRQAANDAFHGALAEGAPSFKTAPSWRQKRGWK